MKQANTASEEELDEILDNITEFLYFKNADGEFVPVNFKGNPVFKEDRDALLAWKDAAVVEARKEEREYQREIWRLYREGHDIGTLPRGHMIHYTLCWCKKRKESKHETI